MDSIPFAQEHGQLTLRWIHVVAGVIWIGMLYFFNWVNSAFAPTLDAETKRKVIPELMPRALWWFRWGAAWTFLTGLFLLVVLYYVGAYMTTDGTRASGAQVGAGLGGIFVGFLVYDALFKALGAKQQAVAVLLWGAIAVLYAWLLEGPLESSARATYIHVGALFGTAMAANVWMRIWPAQRRILAATKAGEAPQPGDVALAGGRSKHNTYMSVPLLLFMVAVHQDALLANDALPHFAWIAIILGIAWVATFLLYRKAPRVKGI